MKPRQVWSLTKQSTSSWAGDYAPSMGAALSYYTLFSIAPLLVIVIAVAGLFFGADAVRGILFEQLQALLGDEGAKAIQEMLTSASRPATGAVASVTSVIGLLVGATTVFNELQSDLDRIWRAPARVRQSGVWKLLRTRLLSFGMVLAMGFLLTVSLVTSAALATLGKWWASWFGGWEILVNVLDITVNFGLLTLVFALIYKMIPRVHVSWHDVWIGAAVTALLFTIGKFLIGLYLGKSDVTSSFGAAGSMVILMLWVYYSAQIFLLGAEFTWNYANAYGSRRNEAKADTPKKSGEVPARSDSDGKASAAIPASTALSHEKAYAAAAVIAAHQIEPESRLQPVAARQNFTPKVRRNSPKSTVTVALAAAAAVTLGLLVGTRRNLLRRVARPFSRQRRALST